MSLLSLLFAGLLGASTPAPVATGFATLADMQARFEERELVQLTDDALTGVVDAGRVAQALASASALVEGYVAFTYQLDLAAPVPLLLVDATCDIARFRLYRQTPPEDVATRNAQAVRTLEAIRSGKVKLDAGFEAVAPRAGKVLLGGGERPSWRDQMRGF